MMPLKDPDARREYHREYMRRRLEDPAYRQKHLARVSRNNARYKGESEELVLAFRAQGCALCPEVEPCCLTAHHLDPSTKKFSVGDANFLRISPKRLKEELAKCVCLCMNCHAKVHGGVVNLNHTSATKAPSSSG